MRIIHVKLFIFSVIILTLFVFNGPVFAQEEPRVYFKLSNDIFAPNSEFIANVLVDSPKPINVIGLQISYPTKNLEFIESNNNESIINIWHGSPLISPSGIIRIEGGLSKPFSGLGGNIISLRFKVRDEDITQLAFKNVEIYYADGLGTRALSTSEPKDINISSVVPQQVLDIIKDIISPDISKIQIIKDPITQNLLAIFNVTDHDSGMRATYIRWRSWFYWSDWELVSNPVSFSKTSLGYSN